RASERSPAEPRRASNRSTDPSPSHRGPRVSAPRPQGFAGLVDLSEEQQAVVATVREFVEQEVFPVAEEVEHRDEFPEKIVEGMKELGLFGLTVPEEYGGAGLDLLTYALVGVE